MAIGSYRPRAVGRDHIWDLTLWRRLRDVHHWAGPTSAVLAPFVFLWVNLGRAWTGHNGKDSGPFSGTAAWHNPRGDHDRHRSRFSGWFLASRLELRPHRKLSGGLYSFDLLLCLRQCGVLDAASTRGRGPLTRARRRGPASPLPPCPYRSVRFAASFRQTKLISPSG